MPVPTLRCWPRIITVCPLHARAPHLPLPLLCRQVKEVHEEEWSYIPVGGPLPRPDQPVAAFGAAASLVHPGVFWAAASALAYTAYRAHNCCLRSVAIARMHGGTRGHGSCLHPNLCVSVPSTLCSHRL